MGVSFSIGGVSFDPMSTGNGRKAIDMDVMEIYSKKKWHSEGTDGEFVVRGGRIGGTITAEMKYIGSATECYSMYNADRNAWKNTAVEIVDIAGAAYERCDYVSNKIKERAKGFSYNSEAKAYMVVEFTFTIDS